MTTTELTYDDRPDWPDGPWVTEPDRVIWRDQETGLVCLVKRHPSSGHLCGYVGVPPGHPFHGRSYSDCSLPEPCGEDYCAHRIDGRLEVHGGLTYGAECDDDPVKGICHLPEPGEPDHLWWLGFDCAHAYDLRPVSHGTDLAGDVYRSVLYVESQCTVLARQLAEVAS